MPKKIMYLTLSNFLSKIIRHPKILLKNSTVVRIYTPVIFAEIDRPIEQKQNLCVKKLIIVYQRVKYKNGGDRLYLLFKCDWQSANEEKNARRANVSRTRMMHDG